jgi:hypothetical protein
MTGWDRECKSGEFYKTGFAAENSAMRAAKIGPNRSRRDESDARESLTESGNR